MSQPRYCYRHPDRETGLSCSECDRPICYECMTPAPVGLRCPDHSGRPQGIRKMTTSTQRVMTGVGSRRVNAVTLALIGINVAVYLAEVVATGSFNGTSGWIYEHGALFASLCCVNGHIAGVAHGEWWRLLTAAFLHYGPFHLAINMYSLFYAGTILEHVIGRWRFVLLYIGSGIAGSAGAIWLSPNSVTVGASGAIFGILGALFVLERRRHIATGGQIVGLIVLNLVFTFALSNISVGGHLGGLVAGVVLMWLLLHSRRSAARSIGATAAIVAISVFVAYMKVRGYS
ncbi:MAG: rhomboid family intramembrane serine protease [Gaiellaceae bacterium]